MIYPAVSFSYKNAHLSEKGLVLDISDRIGAEIEKATK